MPREGRRNVLLCHERQLVATRPGVRPGAVEQVLVDRLDAGGSVLERELRLEAVDIDHVARCETGEGATRSLEEGIGQLVLRKRGVAGDLLARLHPREQLL